MTFSNPQLGLVLIILLGAEMFTGTLNYVFVGLFNNNITIKSGIYALIVSFFGNIAGKAPIRINVGWNLMLHGHRVSSLCLLLWISFRCLEGGPLAQRRYR